MNISIQNILIYLDEMNLDYRFIGDDNLVINKYSSLKNIKSNSITWVKNIDKFNNIELRDCSNLLIVSSEAIGSELNKGSVSFIICRNPKEIFFTILGAFFKQQEYGGFISDRSIVETEEIGTDVYIGHNCFIGKDVFIGDNVVIKNSVTIEGKVRIGRNTIIHSGVVIGTDGYGYFQNNEGKNIRVPHYGGVIIGEDVEIGANTCIDRGTLDDTIIGNNVKIDNLSHIAHNVIIEENCSVLALTILCGSVVMEKNSYIAPGAIIRNQLTVGENSLVGLGALVTKNVESNKVVAGVPAKVIKEVQEGKN